MFRVRIAGRQSIHDPAALAVRWRNFEGEGDRPAFLVSDCPSPRVEQFIRRPVLQCGGQVACGNNPTVESTWRYAVTATPITRSGAVMGLATGEQRKTTPTAISARRAIRPNGRFSLRLRSVASGGRVPLCPSARLAGVVRRAEGNAASPL